MKFLRFAAAAGICLMVACNTAQDTDDMNDTMDADTMMETPAPEEPTTPMPEDTATRSDTMGMSTPEGH